MTGLVIAVQKAVALGVPASAHECLIHFCLICQTCPRKGAPPFSFLHLEVHALVFVFGGPTLSFLLLLFCLLTLLFLGLLPFIHLGVRVLDHHFFETGRESCTKPVQDDVSVVRQEVNEGVIDILSIFRVGAIIQEKLEAGAH
jgi:hypothetical protein